MKKVLLVNPSIVYSTWNADLKTPSPDSIFIRLGLAYLAGALKARGHEVCLIDLRTISGWEEFEEEVRLASPDVVGITIHSIEMQIAVEAAQRSKKVLPQVMVVAGGVHPTMFPDECLETGAFDYVVKGEGEISFPDLVDDPAKFSSSFWGETPDLDKVPHPVRDIWKDYDTRIYREPFGVKGFSFALPMAEMINTRGCPFRCTFCCGPGEQDLYTKISQTGERIPNVRGRSVESVIDEIKFLREKYGIKSVMFHDDQFIMKRSWIEEFVVALHEEGLVKEGFEWVTSSKADIICKNETLIKKMAGAGLKLLIVGFESFSPRVLKWFEKTASVDENFKAAEICKEAGVKVWANYILGVPTDTGWHREDDLMTVEGVLRIDPVHYSPALYTPVPGSALYDFYKNNNLIIGEEDQELLSNRGAMAPKVRGVDYEFLNAIMVTDTIFM
ncbi:MAG: B12-binding domain-containing radical SAM protein [Deltaproteobacteria bacterium]|nr:B12-binding domain-containing radical SAM protein [Deltaproteobacteria bacterium]